MAKDSSGTRIGKVRAAVKGKAARARSRVRNSDVPSPNPLTNLILADIALRAGGAILRRGVERGVLGAKYTPTRAKEIIKGRTMSQALLTTAAAKIATKSIPGAIVIGGGMLAKTLYDRSKGRSKARREGEQGLQDMADNTRED